MRRTMNTNYYTETILANTKMDVAKVLAKLDKARGEFDNLEFKASEVGLKGAQMKVLLNLGVVSVIGKDTVWFQIDEDTMKKDTVNVYIYDTDTSKILEEIKALKVRKIESELEYHKSRIEELLIQLAQM